MTRIRLTLLLLLLGIALPTALIVQRAVESLAVENAVQHDAVADRVFDEMERSLSDFLLREEARPPSDFALDPRALSTPETSLAPVPVPAPAPAPAPAPGRLRAAAFEDANEPFIIGWFAVDPSRAIRLHVASSGASSNGTSSSSRSRADREARIALALREGLASRSTIAQASEDRTSVPEQKSESGYAQKRLAEAMIVAEPEQIRSKGAHDENEASPRATPSAPAPGRTKSLSKKGELRREKADAGLAAQEDASTYDLLQSLNRAQELRGSRQSKVLSEAPKEALSNSATAASSAATNYADSQTETETETAADLQAFGFDQAIPGAQSARRGAEHGSDGARADEEEFVKGFPREIEVDPLASRTTRSGDILLIRSVWQGDHVERQGLVLDREALAFWLEESVLGRSALAERASLVFGPQAEQTSHSAHAYLHRFGEPFEALLARLDLQPLPGVGSARPIYMIVGLLAVVTLLGLFAVERMTRVVVEYAQRRSDFVAAVSHELKTPLTSIRMYSEMLRDGLVSAPEKRDEYYATITDESERLSRLIDNVLEFSRLEQNRREPTLVVGGLVEAIQSAAEKLRAHVEREGFTLEVELTADAPPVQYDRDAVTQLLFNLVDNALKYARDAENREIRVLLTSAERGDLELRVRDFGPGVPEDQMRRIFEPFYRAGEELTRDTAGTGIGLALVKELAEDMGATARGSNAQGGGFEVCITFARATAPA